MKIFDKERFAVMSGVEASRELPEQIPVLRYGKNTYTKLNSGSAEFEFSEKDADAVLVEFSRRGLEIPIDYEHQTLSGVQAPAAGWIDKLEKTKDGLTAKVKYWTETAKKYLTNGEYRYFSPVIKFSRTGRNISGLHSVALTNNPALDDIPALVADELSGAESNQLTINKDKEMIILEKLLKMFSLEAFSEKDIPEQETAIIGKLTALIDDSVKSQEFLKLHAVENFDTLTAKIKSMIPAEEKTKLEKEIAKRDAEKSVTLAMSEGKLTEALKPWAMNFAEKDLAGFSAWCAGAPKMVPDNKNLDGKESDVEALTEAQIKVNNMLGIKSAAKKQEIKNDSFKRQ